MNAPSNDTLTFGEKAVGMTFNPSYDPTVEAIKRRCADLIDEIHELRTNQPNGEIARMASIAMWAVKAATWRF
jgi:hypothetical protein